MHQLELGNTWPPVLYCEITSGTFRSYTHKVSSEWLPKQDLNKDNTNKHATMEWAISPGPSPRQRIGNKGTEEKRAVGEEMVFPREKPPIHYPMPSDQT